MNHVAVNICEIEGQDWLLISIFERRDGEEWLSILLWVLFEIENNGYCMAAWITR